MDKDNHQQKQFIIPPKLPTNPTAILQNKIIKSYYFIKCGNKAGSYQPEVISDKDTHQ